MKKQGNLRKVLYGVTLFFITLSGFAQMPIFKRYYIADIPGLGWLAQFYVTHVIHYAAAVVLLALAGYVLFDVLAGGFRQHRITASAYLKTFILFGLIVSGGLMAFKNLSGVHFSDSTIIILDLTHLGLCMLLIAASVYTLVRKKAWVA